MSDLNFSGRCIAVTGAGSGLGNAYAHLLSRLGATVIVNDIGDVAQAAAEAIVASGGKALAVPGSVTDPDTARQIVDAAVGTCGRIDGVICNAGVGLQRSFEETAIEDYRRILDIHYFGTLHLIKAAWPHMTAAGYGRIVTVVSTTMLGFDGWTAYGAAKGAIFGLSRTLALEAASKGIVVNMLAPGAATPMLFANNPDPAIAKHMVDTMPPELVAPSAAFLVHESCTSSGDCWLSSGGTIALMQLGITPPLKQDQATLDSAAGVMRGKQVRTDLRAVGSVLESLELRR